MMTVEQTIKRATDQGVKQQLLDWVNDNKDWDPSLYSNRDGYYDMGLKIITDTTVKKFPDTFQSGDVMVNLFNNYVSKTNEEKILSNKSYSQLGQDVFVLGVLDYKRKGLFIDVAGGPPIYINNTYLLEKKYEWSGISVDLDHRNKIAWKHSDRNTQFLYENAFNLDYNKEIEILLKEHGATRIDYLSVDLEPPHLTLEILYKIMTSTKHRFSIITFETDVWRDNLHIQKASRDLLKSHGYGLVVDNINNQEDWWIDLTY